MKHLPWSLAGLGALLLLSIVSYGSVLDSFFLSDDFNRIGAATQMDTFEFEWLTGANFVRPLMSASIFIDYKLWGLNPFGFHLTNVLLHGLNAYLVVILFRLLLSHVSALQEERNTLSACAGIVFAILPCHTEAVSWISGRPDLLATLLGLCSLWAYLRFSSRPRWGSLAMSCGFFALALLAKESAIVTPLLIALLGLVAGHTTAKGGLWLAAARLGGGHLLILMGYLAVRYQVLGSLVGGYGSEVHLRLSAAVILKGFVSLSSRVLVPPMPIKLLPIAVFFAGSLALAACLASRRAALGRGQGSAMRLVAFLVLAFVAAVLPVINLGVSKVDTQGERFLYLPSAFATLLIVTVLRLLFDRRLSFLAALAGLSLVWTVSLARSNGNWKKAGDVSMSIVDSLGEIERSERLFVVNLPDSVRGAYIFRNGFSTASSLFHPGGGFRVIRVIAHHYLLEAEWRARVSGSGDVIVIQVNPDDGFFIEADGPKGPVLLTEDYEIHNLGPGGFDLLLKTIGPGDQVVYCSEGRLLQVSPHR